MVGITRLLRKFCHIAMWHGFLHFFYGKNIFLKSKSRIMEKNEKVAEILNDLIQINNDRVDGYEKAVKETDTKDSDLRSLFTDLANDSRNYAAELRKHVYTAGEEPAEGTTARGKIYRVWMDIKAAITGQSRRAILASCEFGEDAAQRAYESALEDADLSGEVRTLVMEQKLKLRKSHDKIKMMRDTQSA
jgi:uncharacterized protein (TIGR02284 family)